MNIMLLLLYSSIVSIIIVITIAGGYCEFYGRPAQDTFGGQDVWFYQVKLPKSWSDQRVDKRAPMGRLTPSARGEGREHFSDPGSRPQCRARNYKTRRAELPETNNLSYGIIMYSLLLLLFDYIIILLLFYIITIIWHYLLP